MSRLHLSALCVAGLLAGACASTKTYVEPELPPEASATIIEPELIWFVTIDGTPPGRNFVTGQTAGRYRLSPGRHVLQLRFARPTGSGSRMSKFDQVLTCDVKAGKVYTLGIAERDYGGTKSVWRAVLHEHAAGRETEAGVVTAVSEPSTLTLFDPTDGW
jgi:hypothetical protein